jgi:hypothetical protein
MRHSISEMKGGLRVAYRISKRSSPWHDHDRHMRPSYNVQDKSEPTALSKAPAEFHDDRLCRPGASF